MVIGSHDVRHAEPEGPLPVVVAAVTQQELADAAGTVREVVARVLKQLHHAGMTAGSDGGVVILDAARLDAEATAGGADAT